METKNILTIKVIAKCLTEKQREVNGTTFLIRHTRYLLTSSTYYSEWKVILTFQVVDHICEEAHTTY